uniref:Uncharacterized protein n=1 Tax=Xenopus tropicalis TaxID=8364 RepID=A0A1B8Y023_XENTR
MTGKMADRAKASVTSANCSGGGGSFFAEYSQNRITLTQHKYIEGYTGYCAVLHTPRNGSSSFLGGARPRV